MQKGPVRSKLSQRSKRIFGIVASILMFITVFHVMVGDARAAETDVEKVEKEILDHDHLRLTTSNIAATLPVAASAAGIMHFAWADSLKSGARLAYKSSSDGGKTFTADRPISEAFYSVLDISIAASDDGSRIAVAAEVYRSDNSAIEVCMVLSEDGAASWSQVIYLGKGHGPTADYSGLKLVVGFTSSGENATFSAMIVERDEKGLNGSWLFRAPLGEGEGAIACDADSVHFIFYPRTMRERSPMAGWGLMARS